MGSFWKLLFGGRSSKSKNAVDGDDDDEKGHHDDEKAPAAVPDETSALLPQQLEMDDDDDDDKDKSEQPSSLPRRHHRGLSDDTYLRGNSGRRLLRHGRDAMLGLNRSFRTSLTAIAEGVPDDIKEAAGDVRAALLQKLQEADRADHSFLLDMSLNRGLSILPEDLADLVQEQVMEELPPPPKEVGAGPLLALLAAIVAISSNGTALSLQTGVVPAMKLYWRMTATALALCVLARVWREWPALTRAQWTTFAMAVACFVAQGILFVTALNYTSIGNAVLFANSQVLILLAGKVLVGEPISLMEGSGAIVAFSGAMLCALDESSQAVDSKVVATDVDDDDTSGPLGEVTGELLALGAALGGVGYLTLAKSVRSHMSVSLFLFLVMFSGSFLVLLYMWVTGVEVEFSLDPYHGMFGWLNGRPDRILTELWIVLVCNLVGALGIVRAMQYFDTLIITVATLLEPLMASLIAYTLGVGNLPGLDGWIGNLLVLFGTLGVIYPSIKSGAGGSGH